MSPLLPTKPLLPFHANEHQGQLLRGLLLAIAAVDLGFALFNLLVTGFVGLALCQGLAAALLLYLYRLTRRGVGLEFARYAVLCVSGGGTLLGVLLTEGRNMNFVWLIVLPLLVYFVMGRRRGLPLAALVGVAAAGVMLHGLHNWPPTSLNGVAVVNILAATACIGALAYFYENSRDDAEAAVMALAQTDPLTRLWNRRYFVQRAEREMELCRRHGVDFSLLLMDIDHFKGVNDRFGHDAGDEMLRRLALQLQQRVRASDVVARLGGEEFGVLLPHTGLNQAFTLAETLRQLIASSVLEYDGDTLACTISIGVAQYDGGGEFTDLYRTADAALYRAKAKGRNRIAMTAVERQAG